jgi:hypothetical protein
MALPPVSKPIYPDVPKAQGVPPVLRQLGTIENVVTTVASDALSILRMFQGPQWGIFDQTGNPVIIGDSVVAVDYRQEYRLADYPIEEGAFATYNKVQQPFDIRVSFAVSGKLDLISSILSGGAIGSAISSLVTGSSPSQASRGNFLQQLDAALRSLYLFTVVTPEKTYPSVNLSHCDYRRESHRGATLLTIDVWCQEVRVAARGAYSKTNQPTGTDPVDGGTKQPTDVQPGDSGSGTGTGGPDPGAGGSGNSPTPSEGPHNTTTATPGNAPYGGSEPTTAVRPGTGEPTPGESGGGGNPAIEVSGSTPQTVPSGHAPIYDSNGAFIGNMKPGAYPLGPGQRLGAVVP